MTGMRLSAQMRAVRCLSAHARRCAGALIVAIVVLLISYEIGVAQMKPGDRRKAYGEMRASVMESLLQTLYPGAVVQWDPALTVQIPGEKPRMVDVGVSMRGSAATGEPEGIASIEFEGLKQTFIFQAQSFQRSDRPNFLTELIVFRADMSGHIQRYKKVLLDPEEPLTELKTMSIKDWSTTEWPTLEIQYNTHRATPTSFTTIEWHSVFDANTSQFISRLPFGITRKNKGAAERDYWLGLSRTSPTAITIGERFSGETRQYECSDPCVMQAGTLLAKWNLDDADAAPSVLPKSSMTGTGANRAGSTNGKPAPEAASSAIIRLKNGRTIHADGAKEEGDKVEYTIGESSFKIPKSMVEEVVHSAEAPPSADTSKPLPTGSSVSVRAKTCTTQGNPHIPCNSAFFLQILMGLGETQRFRLLDDGNHDVTALANWEIDDGFDQVDFSVVNGVPRVYSKKFGSANQGLVHLYGTVGDYTATVRIYLLKPEDIASNKMGRRGMVDFPDKPHALRLIPDPPYFGRMP